MGGSSSNSSTSVPNYDANNIRQTNDRQSKSPPYDQHNEFVYNGNAEHYQSLDTENMYEDTNNSAGKRQSFTLFPSCGVINFSQSSDFESTLASSEENFYDSISKIRSKYLTITSDAQTLNEKEKSCTLIIPYCNTDLNVSYDTDNDHEELNNCSAQTSCLFPSCGIVNFTQSADLEQTTNKSEEIISFTNDTEYSPVQAYTSKSKITEIFEPNKAELHSYTTKKTVNKVLEVKPAVPKSKRNLVKKVYPESFNNVKITSHSETDIKNSATMLEDFLKKYSNQTSMNRNLKELFCSSVNLKTQKTFVSTNNNDELFDVTQTKAKSSPRNIEGFMKVYSSKDEDKE